MEDHHYSGKFWQRPKEEDKEGYFDIGKKKKRSTTDPEVFKNE